jgi:hypothetical protein
MNETLIKYLSGLLDADGSLSFSFRKYDKKPDVFFLGLTLHLASSDAIDEKGFVDSLPSLTGMGGIYKSGDRNQFKSWKISKRSDLEMILPRLTKHMVVKARHWQWLHDTWCEQAGTWFSAEMRENLTTASATSRVVNVGPLKPKNHPTWAWLAGFIDGDGWYRCKHYKCGTYKGHQYYQWMMNVGAVAHKNDASVLDFIRASHGGLIYDHKQSKDVLVWRRNLGPNDASFALRFLPNLAKHSRLKRHKIDQIISRHRQRLIVPTSEEEVIV